MRQKIASSKEQKLADSRIRWACSGGDHVRALARALTLLNRIAEAESGTTLTDLAQQIGLPSSTAHRLLTTLEEERYVKYNREGHLWSIGVQAFVAGSAYTKTRSLVGLARPHMRHLMEESGVAVNLAVEDRGYAVYLAHVASRQFAQAFARPGLRVPLHCSAVGKIVLSAMSKRTLSKTLLEHGMPRLTAKTISSPMQLQADLERVRAKGYATDDEEHAVGLRCVSAPIYNEVGDVIAGISASGPMARLVDERMAQLGELVLRTSKAISTEMGHTPWAT